MAQWAGVTAELAKTTKLPADMMTWFQARMDPSKVQRP